MECSLCGRHTDYSLGGNLICDACVAAQPDLYYSLGYLQIVEQRLAAARGAHQVLSERGVGDDVRSNPTKGRSRLRQARDNVDSLQGSVSLIRSVLIGRGLIKPNLEEQLERQFPNLKHNEVVEWQGKQYRHSWVQNGEDRVGRNLWSHRWDLIE